LKECLTTISNVKREPLVIERIMQIDMSEQDLDIINCSKHAFHITTLIFGCSNRSADFGALNKDRNRTVQELKKVG
jgi:hypothetical protein